MHSRRHPACQLPVQAAVEAAHPSLAFPASVSPLRCGRERKRKEDAAREKQIEGLKREVLKLREVQQRNVLLEVRKRGRVYRERAPMRVWPPPSWGGGGGGGTSHNAARLSSWVTPNFDAAPRPKAQHAMLHVLLAAESTAIPFKHWEINCRPPHFTVKLALHMLGFMWGTLVPSAGMMHWAVQALGWMSASPHY